MLLKSLGFPYPRPWNFGIVTRGHLPDLAVALAEDFIAIAGGLLIVSHI